MAGRSPLFALLTLAALVAAGANPLFAQGKSQAPSPAAAGQALSPGPGDSRAANQAGPAPLASPDELRVTRQSRPRSISAHGPPPPRPPAAASPAGLSSTQNLDPQTLQAFVDGVAAEAMGRRHIAGLAVAVVQDGRTILLKGYGVDRTSPWRTVDPHRTLFRLGAISRLFTWALIRQETSAGHMRLDRPVNLYLPETLRIPDQGFARPILVEDLLNETGGFEDRTLGQAYERDPILVRPLDVYLRQERPRRVRAPGGQPVRSDYGAALAGAALAEVTGKSFEDLVEQRITGPLALTRTSFREPRPARAGLPGPISAGLAGDISDGYHWSATGLRVRPFEYIGQRAPSGSASASAADMARFVELLLGGGVLDGEGIASGPGGGPWRDGLVEQTLPGGRPAFAADGETLSFASNLTLIPDLRLGVFTSANTDTGRSLTGELARRIVEEFYPAPPAPLAAGSGLTQARHGYEGAWLSDSRAWHGLEAFVDHFRTMAWLRVLDDRRLLVMEPDGASRWIAEGVGLTGRFDNAERADTLTFTPAERPTTFAVGGAQIVYRRANLLDRPWVFTLLSALTGLLSVGLLADLPVRARQTFHESQAQGRAAVLQAVQAVLWLVAMALFVVFLWGARDPAALMYNWPGVPLVTASSCALLATALTVPILMLLPLVWRGGRRVDSWGAWRKLLFTLTTLIFLAFGLLLADWGALAPWSA